jgi:DNA-binding transcriptional ArsR family regulator
MANRYVSKTLSELFVSKTRVKVLAYAFMKPAEPFHLRKVARITESTVNTISRELKKLEGLGILFSKREGVKKLFYLNPDFTLKTELRNMIHKELGLGGQLMDLIPNLGKVSLIVMTGTFLSGEPSSPEDLDLLIVGEPDLRMIEVCVKNAEELLDKEINYMVISDQEYQMKYRKRDSALMKALGEEGMILYKAENFS